MYNRTGRGWMAATTLKNKWHWLLIVGLPPLVFAMGLSPLNQLGYIDPPTYSGYIVSYNELLERFGRTYYSTRIAMIYPARLAQELLGVKAGYLVLRWIFLSANLAVTWAIARKFWSTQSAVLLMAMMAFHPWLLRDLTWDYVEGFSLTYLMLSIWMIVAPPSSRIQWAVLSGIFFSLSTNAYFFSFGPGILFFIAWFMIAEQPRFSRMWWQRGLAILAGFSVSYLALSFLLYRSYPQGGFWGDAITLSFTMRSLAGGASGWHAAWYVDLRELQWGTWLRIAFPVFVLIVSCIVFAISKKENVYKPNLAAVVIIYLASVIALFLVLHFAFQHYAITSHWTFSLLFPATWLSIISIICNLMSINHEINGKIISITGIFGVALSWIYGAYYLDRFITYEFSISVVSFILILFLIISIPRFHKSAASAVILFAIASPFPFRVEYDRFFNISKFSGLPLQYDRFYLNVYRGFSQLEWDVYSTIPFLHSEISSLKMLDGKIGFWYADDLRGPVNAIQSSFLWGYSRIHETPPGMPVIDSKFLKRLEMFRYIVLLGTKPGEVQKGMEALHAAGIQTQMIRQTQFVGTVLTVDIVILKKS